MSEEKIQILVRELGTLPLFEGLTPQDLRGLVEGSRVARYGKDDPLLFQEGDKADSVCIVLRGEIEILKHDTTGAEYLLTVLPAGDFLGERCLLEEGTRSATARAKGEALVLFVGRPEYDSMLAECPRALSSLLLRMMTAVSDRLRLLNEHYVLTKGCLDRLKNF